MPGERKRARTVDKIQHSSSTEDENFEATAESDEELTLEQNGVHPLIIDVIVKTIFEYVKPYDLKERRLVCKKWNILTLPSARSTFATTIHGNLSSSPDAADHRTADFYKLFGSNRSGLPFTKFILGSFETTVGHGKECLQLFGENAKELDLFKTGDFHFIENISEILKSVPNLEYFKVPVHLYPKPSFYLKNSSHDISAVKLFPGPDSEIPALKRLKTLEVEGDLTESRKKVCPTFFEELLTASENISTIFASQCFPISSTGLELLTILEKLGREPRLEILSLTHVVAEHLEVLKKMVGKTNGLKLKHLSISQGISLSPDTWFQILDLLKENLLSLQVHKNSVFPEDFPRMAVLKLLDFRFEEGLPISNWTIHGFCNSFPALQYLRLSSDEEFELNEFYIGSEICSTMKSLYLGNFGFNIQTFERTLNVFPNLTELEMDVAEDDAHLLPQIWTQMTRLEKLKIYGRFARGSNVESVVTGICSSGVKKIRRRKLKTLKEMTMEARRETISTLIKKYRTRPSIGNLTNLKYLMLNMTATGGRYGEGKLRLSDLTGYFGFYSMKNLQHLSISNCKLSKSCSEQLVTDTRLDSWKFQGPGKWDIIPPIWSSNNYFDWDKFPCPKF